MHLLICLDGCDPSYLAAASPPTLNKLAQAGFYKEVRSVVPSVTNVNNLSIITGLFPEAHGITSNFTRRRDGTQTYMESAEFVLCPTILETARRMGLRTAAITSKAKLLEMIGRGADIAVAAETPTAELLAAVGPALPVYSLEINVWAFQAAHHVLKTCRPDLTYLSTTDYIMHAYSPELAPAIEHLLRLDEILSQILNDFPDLTVTVTADHGMNGKTVGIDIEKTLASHGIRSQAIPIIKDKYVQHHFNQGGAAYVYLDEEDVSRSIEILRHEPGVESVLTRAEAARRFRLRSDRIGDLFVLADKVTVFGSYSSCRKAVNLRSHGSVHESRVPLLTNDPQAKPSDFLFNVDAGSHALAAAARR